MQFKFFFRQRPQRSLVIASYLCNLILRRPLRWNLVMARFDSFQFIILKMEYKYISNTFLTPILIPVKIFPCFTSKSRVSRYQEISSSFDFYHDKRFFCMLLLAQTFTSLKPKYLVGTFHQQQQCFIEYSSTSLFLTKPLSHPQILMFNSTNEGCEYKDQGELSSLFAFRWK